MRAASARLGRPVSGAALATACATLLVAAAACQGPERGLTRVEAAEAATAAENWPRAAELWGGLHVAGGGRDRRAVYETARALHRTGDSISACNLLLQGLVVFPDDPDLLEVSGLIQRECGFRRAAEDCYARAVAADPSRRSALRALVELRMELGHEKAAEAPLRRLIGLEGGDAWSLALLGDVQRLDGDELGAFRSYERAIALGTVRLHTLVDAASLALNPAVASEVPNALERADAWLREALERAPQTTRAHYLLGYVCEQQGRPEEAARHYRRAVETDPGCIQALTGLAVLYARIGDGDATSEIVARALEIEGDPSRRAALLELLGSGIR